MWAWDPWDFDEFEITEVPFIPGTCTYCFHIEGVVSNMFVIVGYSNES